MPNLALLVLDKFNWSEKSMEVYDFRFLDPRFKSIGNEIENHPLQILSNTENTQLMSHKVVKKLAKLKWNPKETKTNYIFSNAIIFFGFNLLLYILNLVTTTILVIKISNFYIEVLNSTKSASSNSSSSSYFADSCVIFDELSKNDNVAVGSRVHSLGVEMICFGLKRSLQI